MKQYRYKYLMFPINASYLGTTGIKCYAFGADNKTNTPDSLNKLTRIFMI